MKELEINFYLFQFYHEVDVKRAMNDCPWSFNRRALIMQRMKEGDIPRNIALSSLDLWMQVYDLKPGFMSEKILTEVGNYVGKFVASCPSNLTGVWRDYFRIRVTVDVTKPLKRKMKIKKAAQDWFWINFKYENVLIFCFICGIIGHSEEFCSRLFVVAEADIVKPYGPWICAPFKIQIKLIDAKWLRSGADGRQYNFPTTQPQSQHGGEDNNRDQLFTPRNQETDIQRANQGNINFKQIQKSGNGEIWIDQNQGAKIMVSTDKDPVTVIESKKRRTSNDLGLDIHMDSTILLYPSEDVNMNIEQVSPSNNSLSKNGSVASIHGDARLVL